MILALEPTGREAVPDRETIETALQRVQSGELSPAEAASLILAEEVRELTSGDAQNESLASLVHRLGTPPPDIVEAWCQQLGDIASEHEHETGESLPAFDLNQWSITPQGDLAWQGRRFGNSGVRTKPSRVSLGRIDEFRSQLVPNRRLAPEASGFSDAVAPSAAVIKQQGTSRPTTKVEQQPHRRMGPTARRALFIAVLLVCVSIVVSILYSASRGNVEPIANIDAPAAFAVDLAPSPPSIPNPPGTDPGAADSPVTAETVETLETFESLTEAELSSLEAAAVEMKPSFSLDDLLPPAASFVPQLNASDETNRSSRSDGGPIAKDSETPGADSVAQAMVDDDASPSESPQQTRTSTVMSVELHPLDQTAEPTSLSESNLTGLKLDFPFDVPLTFSGDDSNWEIRDARQETSVASITPGPDGLGLTWSARAQHSPSASALAHGRITDRGGSTIFLRPIIEANPWPMRFDVPDIMPTWNLRYPIPPRAARIAVVLEIPDELEQGWMEPIPPESLRRTRGVVVLTPKDGETVSLGVRFDIRCSRKLTCRIRFAGRLDPSMPWQIVSNSMLAQFADQLAQQAVVASNEASRLAAVYELAGTSGRRILRVKRDRNDAQADLIRTASQRVAELQTLMAALEAEGLLKIRIWVEWPEAQQNLLTMPAIDAGAEQRADLQNGVNP